jgi:hypothetical protein
MSQHFLLSAAARDTFKRIRWSENNAEPFCPHCGWLIVYTLAETPPRWKCSACRRKVVVVAREVNGRTRPFVLSRESEAVPLIRQHVASSGGGPILSVGISAMFEYGVPPPRIVNSAGV